jgi:hypothetical protein
MTVELQDTGMPLGWPHSLALDEKHNRLYASGQYAPARKWHIWYWDLNANGAFHGEVAAREGRKGDPACGGAPGSYKEEGWSAYPEGWISFGPDDPDYRFLYTSRTDLGNGYRLDLEKKEVWILNGPAKAGGGSKFEFAGMRGLPVATPHCAPFWLANGDFAISAGGSGSWGLFMFKRVK